MTIFKLTDVSIPNICQPCREVWREWRGGWLKLGGVDGGGGVALMYTSTVEDVGFATRSGFRV